MQALPGSYQGWMLLDTAVAALTDADSVAGAVDAMRELPALYSAAMLPKVRAVAMRSRGDGRAQGLALRVCSTSCTGECGSCAEA